MDWAELANDFRIDSKKKEIIGRNVLSIKLIKNFKSANSFIQLYNIGEKKIVAKYSLSKCDKIEREIKVLSELKEANIGTIDGLLLPEAVQMYIKDSDEKITVLFSLYSGESLTNILTSGIQINQKLLGKILFNLGGTLKKLHRKKVIDKMNSWTQNTYEQIMFGEYSGPYWQYRKIKATKDFIHKSYSNDILAEIENCTPSWTHGDFFPHQVLFLKSNPEKVTIIDWDAANKGLGLSDLAQFWASFELAILFSGQKSILDNMLKLFEKGYDYELSNSLLFRLLELNALFRFSPFFKKGLGVVPRSKKWNIKSGKSKYLHYSFWYSIYLHEELINERILQINQFCHNQKVSS